MYDLGRSVWVAGLTLVVFMSGCVANESGDAVSHISVSETSVKVPTGREISIECLTQFKNMSAHWINPNGTSVQEMNSTRLFMKEDATLVIKSTALEDSGMYHCVTFDLMYNASSTINVYVMPDYQLESMIILGINAVLLGIFVCCLIYSYIGERRMQRKNPIYTGVSTTEKKG